MWFMRGPGRRRHSWRSCAQHTAAAAEAHVAAAAGAHVDLGATGSAGHAHLVYLARRRTLGSGTQTRHRFSCTLQPG